MTCSHCNLDNPETEVVVRAVEGGRAFADTCARCGHTLRIRPRVDSDPPVTPFDLSTSEIDRLRFVQWRLSKDIKAQSARRRTPRTAA